MSVRAAGGEVDEEGRVFATVNEFDYFLSEGGIHLVLDAGFVDAFGEMLSFNKLVFLVGLSTIDVVIFDKDASAVVVVGRDAEVIVEASFQRAGDGDGVPVFAVPEVPLANRGGLVTLGFQ